MTLIFLFRDTSAYLQGANYSTRNESLVIPDLSGTSVYLVAFDETDMNYFLCKYVFAESKYFWTLIDMFDHMADAALISDTDLFFAAKEDITNRLMMTRISKLASWWHPTIDDSDVKIFNFTNHLDFPSLTVSDHNIEWGK